MTMVQADGTTVTVADTSKSATEVSRRTDTMPKLNLDGPAQVARIGEPTGTVSAAHERARILTEFKEGHISLCDEDMDLWPELFLNDKPSNSRRG